MNLKKSLIIVGIAVLLLTAGITVLILRSGSDSDDVETNADSVTGNTAGNLNNGGLFCEYEDTVYFANPYDGGALYSMKADETKVKRISKVSVKSLNVDKRRIYYVLSGDSAGSGLGYIRKATGMYSIKKNGTKMISYTQDPVGIAALCGNKLFYQHYTRGNGTDLDCITTKKKNNHTVIQNMVSPASIDNGRIYYNGADDDMYLYALDTASESSSVIYQHNMYNPVYYNGDFYYMDLETNYQLHRYNPSTHEDTVITYDRVDNFNVYNGIIYYQKDSSADDAGIYRTTVEGGVSELVYSGIYSDINCTSNYVYFHPYDSLSPMYHAPVYGGSVTLFDPGVD